MSNQIHVHNENAVVEGGLKMDLLFEVKNAYFTYDQQYMGGKTPLLKLEGIDHDDNAEHYELWSIGNNWEPTENGDYVVPLKGQKGFNSNSVIGMVISRIANKSYGEECYEDLMGKSLRRGSNWKGTVWQMGAVEVDDIEKDEHGKPKKKLKRLPVEYLGISKECGGNWVPGGSVGAVGSGGAVGNTGAVDPAALMAQMAAMQAGSQAAPSPSPAPVQAAPAPAPAQPAAQGAQDQLAALQAQMAALQSQAQPAAQPAQPAQTVAAQPAANQPPLVYYKQLDQSRLKEFALAAKNSADNNTFMIAAFGIDAGLANGKTPDFTVALMGGQLRTELMFLASGLQ